MTLDDVCELDQVAIYVKDYIIANALTIKQDPFFIAQRYRKAVVSNIARHYAMRNPIDTKLNLVLISLHELRVTCGRFGSRGKEQYWWPILNKQFPLITIVTPGHMGQLTKAKTMFEYDWEQQWVDTIEDIIAQDPEADVNYDWVAIDLDNLGNYMLSATSKRVIDSAAKIFAVAEKFRIDAGWGKLPMFKQPAKSGRMYYGGVNLQNCPSSVRHAALGIHWSYDLKTSVYAWQVSTLRDIQGLGKYDNPQGTSYTREYIVDKASVRAQFVNCFKDSYLNAYQIDTTIKQALTAIGFGARKHNAYMNGHQLEAHGIAGIIKHKESRDAFMNHAWIKQFIKEQDAIIDTITEFQIAHDPEWRTDPRAQNNGRYSKKVFISFLYQRSESLMIQDIMACCKASEVILWVHDGFCTRHKIDLANINFILQDDYGYGIELVPTFHKGWADPRTPHATKQQLDVQEHVERAQRHQAELAMWASKGVDVSKFRNNVIQMPKFKNNNPGHYDNSTSDYDTGKNSGLVNEQEFIKRIYGN